MGLFWSNSWSLALIFCTNANKNPTFNLSTYFFFLIFESQKIGKIIKNSKLLGTPNRLLETTSKIMEIGRASCRERV